MSSLYVRQLTSEWLSDAGNTVPFYDTINKEQNPQDDIWCTCRYNNSYRETLTYCDNSVEENGEIEIVYFGQPGIGDEDLIAAAEADMVLIMASRDPSGKMVYLTKSPPIETSSGSAEQMYSISFYIDYVYYE